MFWGPLRSRWKVKNSSDDICLFLLDFITLWCQPTWCHKIKFLEIQKWLTLPIESNKFFGFSKSLSGSICWFFCAESNYFFWCSKSPWPGNLGSICWFYKIMQGCEFALWFFMQIACFFRAKEWKSSTLFLIKKQIAIFTPLEWHEQIAHVALFVKRAKGAICSCQLFFKEWGEGMSSFTKSKKGKNIVKRTKKEWIALHYSSSSL